MSEYTPVQRVEDIYRVCNPDLALQANDPRYVDLTENRGSKQIAASITRRIKRSEKNAQVKFLFTGHRGSGKSTELLRLKQELEHNKYFTIYMDMEDLLDLGSLSYLDVLVTLAQQVEKICHEQGFSLPKELLERISAWFSECIVEEIHTSDCNIAVETAVESGLKIPLLTKLLAKVNAEIKHGSTRRKTIREKLGRELSVLIHHLNFLLATARQIIQEKGFHDLVLIVDGMEKMHYEVNSDGISTHTELFIRHAEQLRAPECHIIYTVPVSLAYNQNLGSDFDAIEVLPMVRLDAAGRKKLLEVIERRVALHAVFAEPDLAEKLVNISGGVVRDLMRLLRMASDTDADTITAQDINYAVSSLQKEYDRLIRSEDIPYFRQIQQEGRIQGGDERAGRLLNHRLVLEYQNGERWAALHPVAATIPWVQQKLEDVS